MLSIQSCESIRSARQERKSILQVDTKSWPFKNIAEREIRFTVDRFLEQKTHSSASWCFHSRGSALGLQQGTVTVAFRVNRTGVFLSVSD
jgi:hypothetical protein